ncbi:MAG: transglutaminase domain-containing protein, partial [Burkholderiales bacterium]
MTDPAEKPCSAPPAATDAPERWLGSSSLLDLGDPRLRLRTHSLTQLCKSERDKALTLYGFVKRIAFAKPLKIRLRTAREVLDAGRGDAPDKVVLLVSMLRLSGIPARIRYVELRGEILRGLTSNIASAARPVVEIWLNGRWVRTDTYIFDAGYMAAARQRLKDHNWDWGYGIHRNGQSIWNGVDSAYVGGQPTEQDPMVVADLGLF